MLFAALLLAATPLAAALILEHRRLRGGARLALTSPVRTVVDLVRYRRQVGRGCAQAALRRFLGRGGAAAEGAVAAALRGLPPPLAEEPAALQAPCGVVYLPPLTAGGNP